MSSETYGLAVRSLLTQSMLDTVELFAIEIRSDGLASRKEFPVDDSLAIPPDTEHDLSRMEALMHFFA